MAFMDLKKIRGYSHYNFNYDNKNYLIKLCSYNTAQGFNHKAEIYEVVSHDIFTDEIYIAKKIINYLNRTWERFTFESVILGILNKVFKDDYLKAFNTLMDSVGAPHNKKDLREEGGI